MSCPVVPAPSVSESVVYVKIISVGNFEVWNAEITAVPGPQCHVDLDYGVISGPLSSASNVKHLSQASSGQSYWARESELDAQTQGSPRWC